MVGILSIEEARNEGRVVCKEQMDVIEHHPRHIRPSPIRPEIPRDPHHVELARTRQERSSKIARFRVETAPVLSCLVFRCLDVVSSSYFNIPIDRAGVVEFLLFFLFAFPSFWGSRTPLQSLFYLRSILSFPSSLLALSYRLAEFLNGIWALINVLNWMASVLSFLSLIGWQ